MDTDHLPQKGTKGAEGLIPAAGLSATTITIYDDFTRMDTDHLPQKGTKGAEEMLVFAIGDLGFSHAPRNEPRDSHGLINGNRRRTRGRPPKDPRCVFEGILWVLRTGARWRDLPKDFGVSATVCWKRLALWEEQGVWLRLWRAFLGQLDQRGKLDWQECFLDGSFGISNQESGI
jgi:hypothetical protein